MVSHAMATAAASKRTLKQEAQCGSSIIIIEQTASAGTFAWFAGGVQRLFGTSSSPARLDKRKLKSHQFAVRSVKTRDQEVQRALSH